MPVHDWTRVDAGLFHAGQAVEERPSQVLERRIEADVHRESSGAGAQQGEPGHVQAGQLGLVAGEDKEQGA